MLIGKVGWNGLILDWKDDIDDDKDNVDKVDIDIEDKDNDDKGMMARNGKMRKREMQRK